MSKKNNVVKVIIYIVVITIIAMYIVYSVYIIEKQPKDVIIVTDGEITLEQTAIGYIIRNEKVIQGETYKNGMKQMKMEGERVAKDEAIFRYNVQGEEKIAKQIQELNAKIQESLLNQKDIFSSDIKLLDNKMQEELLLLSTLNDIQQIEKTKNDLDALITKKAKISGDLSPAGSYIKQLINEKSKLEQQINSSVEYVKAPESGVLSYRVDGLEEILSASDFTYLTSDFLNKLDAKTGQVISQNEESGKILDNFNCYIATILNNKKKEDILSILKTEEGNITNKNVTLRLSTAQEINAKIEYVSFEEENTIIVFKIKKCVEDLIDYRKISFDIVWWNDEGLKIPNTAILNEGERSYITKNKSGYLEKIPIKILKTNSEYSIVENYNSEEVKELGYGIDEIKTLKKLSLYDEILNNNK